MKPLDKKDITILEELLKDGRLSFSELGDKIKLSVPATASRVQKLTNRGIIESFTISIDFSLLTDGKPNIILIKTDLKEQEDLANKLYQNKYVKQVFFTTGEYNIVVLTNYINDKEKGSLISLLSKNKLIEKLNVLWLFDSLKEKRSLTVDNPKDIKIICDYCKREFTGEIFTKVIGNKKRYFCCEICRREFEKTLLNKNR